MLNFEIELSKIRAGKASPAMLQTVMVDYYGSPAPLSQVANINTMDARTITVQPWEKAMINPIMKGIINSNLGFAPQSNGESVLISVPPLTEDRRKELVKRSRGEGENAKVGIRNSNAPIKVIKIEKKIELTDGKKTILIEPSKISLDIDFELKYENPFIGTQRNLVKVYESDLTEIYNSRTFCLFEDIDKLKEMGLAKGGSLDNALVVKNDQILNEKGLRNEKEFVNHKILDCMGDLYLAGYKIIGKIVCSQGGHKLTNQLLRKVFQDKENFSLLEIQEKNLPHAFINKSHLRSIA